ncbi:MAG: restriction endonuclease subunit S [Treponema sp.]|nr:restriction endonuclease subunit S [Treponema sp.]
MSAWKKVKIGDLCKIVKGATGIASAEPGEYPLVVTAEERKTCSTYQFDCEAVCIPLVSSSGHGKKSLKNVHYQSGKFALGTILCAVIPSNPDELDARYLHQYLQFYKDTLLVPLMKGAANVSLSMKDIATVEFPLPPIEKQRELATLFVNATEKQKLFAAEFQKQTEYAKLLRQNILQQAIEGKLTADWRKQNPVQKGNPDYDAEALFEKIQKGEVSPSLQPDKPSSATPSAGSNAARNARSKTLAPITDEEKPFEIPEGWEWVRLGNVSRINGGYSFKSTEYTEKGIRVIRISDFNENGFVNSKIVRYKDSDAIKPYHLEEKNILMALTGGTVGKSFFVSSLDESMAVNQRVATIKIDYIKPEYVNILVKSLTAQKIIQEAKHSSNDNISLPDLTGMPFSLPPLKEQEEIVNKVETLLAKVATLENQIQERKTLSEKLIFGIMKENLEAVKNDT